MANWKDHSSFWDGAGGNLPPLSATSFAEALERISSQWSVYNGRTAPIEQKRDIEGLANSPVRLGQASCGPQAVPEFAPTSSTTMRRPSQESFQPWLEQDSPASHAGISPSIEGHATLGRGDVGFNSQGGSRRSSRRASLGEEAGGKQREWYQRVLLALKVKQAKGIEEMEARFEEELQRRSEMHETALQQMAAQAVVASSSAQACAVAQGLLRGLEDKLQKAQELVGELQARLQKQEEDLELKREYDLYKLRSAHGIELAALEKKQQEQIERVQAEVLQAVAARDEATEGQQALKLQHDAAIRHLKEEHEAHFASAHAQVLAAQQSLTAREDSAAAHSGLVAAEVRREYDLKLASAMSAMQDSHAERCHLLEEHMQQAMQRQSQEYELVIEELRALLASQSPSDEPIPSLRQGGSPPLQSPPPTSTRAPIKANPVSSTVSGPASASVNGPGLVSITRQGLSRSRPGQRPPTASEPAVKESAPAVKAATPAVKATTPAGRTQTIPAPLPSLPLPRGAQRTTEKSRPANGPRRPVNSPERGSVQRQPSVHAKPEPTGRFAPGLATPPQRHEAANEEPGPRVPYQDLMDGLREVDQRLMGSPPKLDCSERGGNLSFHWQAEGLGDPPREQEAPYCRPERKPPVAKRAPGGNYLDRLLRQLREEQPALRSGARELELLSTGTKSLPARHWDRTGDGMN